MDRDESRPVGWWCPAYTFVRDDCNDEQAVRPAARRTREVDHRAGRWHHGDDVDTPPSLPPSLPPDPVSGAGCRVLVLDDEPAIRRFVKAALQESGYEVAVAGNGAEAVTLFQSAALEGRRFGVVLLDLRIAGGMGGLETLARLRAIDPQVRAIASSGQPAEEIMEAPLLHGFVGTLAKPYTLDELERAVAEARRAAPLNT